MRLFILFSLSVLSASAQINFGPGTGPTGATGATGPSGVQTQSFTPTQNGGTDVVCALHADVITGLVCNNQVTDGTTTTAFSTTTSIKAGTISSNTTTVALNFGYVSSGTAASAIISIKLGSTVVFTSASIAANSSNTGVLISCDLVAGASASATTPVIAGCAVGSPTNTVRNTLISTTTKSISVDTTVDQTLSVTAIFGAATSGNALWLYSISPGSGGAVGATGPTGGTATASNCSSSASPAACSSAAAGSVAIPTGVTSVALTVNTTAVTANSQIFLVSDDTLGTKLGVTCNSTLATLVGGMAITARTAATSFQITYSGTIATNPLCVSYLIVN